MRTNFSQRTRKLKSSGSAKSAQPGVSSLQTEQPNPSSADIDSLDTLGILTTIQKQDATVPAAVAAALPEIARVVDAVALAIRRGGRLIYVGAGTSGRIAVMDAAECPPTFGVSAYTVQAIIAGGRTALTEATERTEDDEAQARRDMASRKVGNRDVVIGLTASGRTPYTIAALRYARSRRAKTVAITSNPGSPIMRAARISIVIDTGPEVVAGSTRMKAALAQKMVLHMISTSSMIQLGHVYRNYMVGVRPTNQKLIMRAINIIQSVTGANETAADKALRRAGWNVKLAILMLRTGLDRTDAQKLLNRYHGNLRAIP